MIGREFVKRIKLLFGRTETIRTTFDLNKAGKLVENIVVETHDAPTDPHQAQLIRHPKVTKP
jgi:hypothetical protein